MARESGRFHARGLALALSLASGLSLAHVHGSARAATQLAFEIDPDPVRDPDLDRALGIAREFEKIVTKRLGLNDADGIAATVLAGTLDDFTQANLTGIDLANAGLVGIRWSELHTQWPPGDGCRTTSGGLSRDGPGFRRVGNQAAR